MTPSSAKAFHEIRLTEAIDSETLVTDLANSQINPTNRQVYHFYDNWRKHKYGGRDTVSVIEVLQRKKEDLLKSSGVHIFIKEKPMIVAIVTPIMKLAFMHGYADEMIFIDSSGSCDEASTCVSFIFAVTKAGAIPLAAVLHTAQSESNYTMAFLAVKGALEDQCDKILNPKVIMTDDSAAEAIFPEARLLLCIFHVCQALWRWIWQSEHKIKMKYREDIMNLFRLVLYAQTREEAEDYMKKLLSDFRLKDNKLAVQHFERLWDRRTDWCLSYKDDVLTRGNNTNNYCEASIRIFKDVVLQRCKVFNACALVDFISKTFENYHKRRLLDFAYSRRRILELAYIKFLQKAQDISKIYQISDTVFQIESTSLDNTLYSVYTDIPCCDCPAGKNGSFFKHLCAIEKEFHFLFHTSPHLSKNDRKNLAILAMGERVGTCWKECKL